MALQLNLTESDVGLAIPEAYARIVVLQFDTKSGEVTVYVDIHATAAARNENKNPVSGRVYRGKVGVDMPNLDDTIPGIRAAIYNWLKTLSDFAGALDV